MHISVALFPTLCGTVISFLPCLKLPSCVPVCPTVRLSASQACLTASLSLHTHTHTHALRERQRESGFKLHSVDPHTHLHNYGQHCSKPSSESAKRVWERKRVRSLEQCLSVFLSLSLCVVWGQHRMWQRRNVKPKKQQQVECVVFGMTNSLTKFALQRNQMEVTTTTRSTRMCVHAVA